MKLVKRNVYVLHNVVCSVRSPSGIQMKNDTSWKMQSPQKLYNSSIVKNGNIVCYQKDIPQHSYPVWKDILFTKDTISRIKNVNFSVLLISKTID